MVAKIEGRQRAIAEVLGGDFVYRVPRYQRPYAWTKENAGLLLDDLLDAMGAGSAAVEQTDPYFMGTVVLIKEEDKPLSDVVDGQQRLTTLSILLAALRDTLEDGSGLKQWILVEANVFTKTEAQYRLTLRERDAQFFREHVQQTAGIDKLRALDPVNLEEPQQRIRENALMMVERLAKLDDATLQRLAQFILLRCYLIVVTTPNLDAAYRIFSVLNDRGLDLSYTDILKADVVGHVPKNQEAKYAKLWEDLEVQLGRDGFEQVFAHLRTIVRKDKPRGTILHELRESVKPADQPALFVDNMLKPLVDKYEILRTATYESSSGAERVNTLIKQLNRIDNIDWMPPAMLFLWRSDSAGAPHFLEELERQAAMMMILRANVNERMDRYGLIMKELEAGREPFREGSPVLAADAEERAKCRERLNGDVYGDAKTRLFIVTRLDEELSDEGATYARSVITLEHVLPQTPPSESGWLKWFPDLEVRESWTGRLANLVLLGRRKNSEAQNYEFMKKKTVYFQSPKTKSAPFALTAEVLQVDEWTPSLLATRQERLVNVLAKAWRL